MNQVTAFLLLIMVPIAAIGHHSTNDYDFDVIEELEGEVVTVAWRNPHIRLTIRVVTEDGAEEIWDLEGQSATALARRGLQRDPVQPGETIRVAGNLSPRRDLHMYVTNIRLQSGVEIRTRGRNTQPRFGGAQNLGFEEVDIQEIRAAAGDADGIFRVWMREEPGGFPVDLPLTPTASNAQASWNTADDLTRNCLVGGMPGVMMRISGPHPLDFTEAEDTIVMRLESFDVVRTIHMNSDGEGIERPATALGYSEGDWEGETLVVRTTRINSPYFDAIGSIPQGDAVEIIERFTLDEDGHQLVYDLRVSDPATFTEPVSGHWILGWRPDMVIEPFECTLDG